MDTVDLIATIQKMTGVNAPTMEKQKSLNVSDVWHVWDILTAKYDTIEVINLISNFARDEDLKTVITSILKELDKDVDELHQLLLEHGIPMPMRPPQSANTTVNLEVITDRYIFNRILDLSKQLIPLLGLGFINSGSPIMIKFFQNHMKKMMKIVNNLSVYGEVKGYINPIPVYRPS